MDLRNGSGNSARRASLLVAASAFLLFGLNNVATSAFPGYLMLKGGSPLLAGLQNSVFVLLAIGLRIPLEPLVAKWGSKFAMLAGALGYTIPCLALIWCDSLWQIVALRLAQAIGLAAFQPSIAQYLTATSRADELGSNLGLVRFATTASFLAGPTLLFPLMGEESAAAFFAALGAVGCAGFLLAALAPSPRNDGCAKPSVMRKPAEAPSARACQDSPRAAQPSGARRGASALNRKRAVMLIAGPLLLAWGYSVVMSFGRLFSQSSLAACPEGMLFAFMGIGGLAGCLASGWLADAIGAKRSVASCIAACGCGLLLMAEAPFEAGVLAGSLLFGAGYFGGTTSFIAAAGKALEHAQPDAAGTFLARQQSGLDAGMVLGSAVGGFMLQASLPVAFIFLIAALAALACIPVWGMVYPSDPGALRKESSHGSH